MLFLNRQSINNLNLLAMKSLKLALLAFTVVVTSTVSSVKAQEEDSSPWDAGFDMYTSYIWRGAKFGSGPAFQPWVSAGFGGFEIGAWGSINSSYDESLEMDLYASYGFDFGLSVGVTDYYFGGDWMDPEYNHYIEPMVSYEIGGFSATVAYMLLPGVEADAAAGTEEVGFGEEGDIYLELGYAWDHVNVAVGAGDGQYVSADDDFMLCNITVGTSKEIALTEKFSLPLSGAVTLNPSTGGFYITAGVSF